MPLEIICDNCNLLIYAGYDLRYVRETIKPKSTCKNCSVKLSQTDYAFEIVKLEV